MVDGEMAEPVSEVLARFIPDGVVIESTAISTPMDESQAQPVGPLRVFGFLPVDEWLEETRRKLEESLWYLGRIRPLPPVQYRTVQGENWAEAWKVHYRPIAVGRRLMIVPAWLETPDKSRLAVRIDPGMAFGTGTHPTTQLCLELVETVMDEPGLDPAALDVIDVGCGTAILSIAALKLGARHALGVDIDAEAVKAAQENAKTNGETARLELGIGSLAEVLDGRFSLQSGGLVLANILAPVLVRLLGEGLAGLMTEGGSLVLSGILAEQSPQVEAAAEQAGLRLVERRQMGDWVALLLKSVTERRN